MDFNGKIVGVKTPSKDPRASTSKVQEISKFHENFNPNIENLGRRPSDSPAIKSAKSQKSAKRIANPVATPRYKIRERRFVVAKKNQNKDRLGVGPTVSCKCEVKYGGNVQKCLCVAYENLRASQEEFFKNKSSVDDRCDLDQLTNSKRADVLKEEEKIGNVVQAPEIEDFNEKTERGKATDPNNHELGEIEPAIEMHNSMDKKRRDNLLEEAMYSVPAPGSGRVKQMVKIFERVLSIPKSEDLGQKDENEQIDTKKGLKWALPGLQPEVPDMDGSLSSLCPSDLFLTSENLGLDSNVSSSWDNSQGSISTRTSCGGRRSRRNSSESSGTTMGRNWRRRQLKVTNQKPFKLRTEQRGRQKEEEFIKKVQEMMVEEEKRRIPIAQGLPWTTDEPECLIKPPVKDNTRPLDLKLHSDVRAVERADFDHQVAEKLSLIEQYRMERERQQKSEEEEKLKRLRKELVPKAQPMPYFDRPFIPKRSVKDLTVPKEPKFHIPDHKKIKCCLSWNDINIYSHHHE